MSLRSLFENAHGIHLKAETLAPAASYSANGFGFAFGVLTFNQWMMAGTLALGIATFGVNYYFARKRDARARRAEQREDEYHRARLASLQPTEGGPHAE